MKKFVFTLLCCILFLFFICFPHAAVSASKQGLQLWFTQILPTLLPFFVSSRMSILRSEIHSEKIFCLLLVLCGFLFGFPIGCKLTADFYSSNYISREKASALCCFTNNLSPVFVITAIQEILQLPLSPVYVFLIYGIPFLYGMSMLLLYHRTPSSTQKETASRFHMDMQIIDARHHSRI